MILVADPTSQRDRFICYYVELTTGSSQKWQQTVHGTNSGSTLNWQQRYTYQVALKGLVAGGKDSRSRARAQAVSMLIDNQSRVKGRPCNPVKGADDVYNLSLKVADGVAATVDLEGSPHGRH